MAARKIVVVGNGMVGHHYVEQLIASGRELDITVLGAEPRPAYDRVHLSEFFAGRKPEELALTTREHYRAQGVKAGMVRPRWIRPWPTAEIAEALSNVKAVACVETSTSYGGAMRGGNLIHEVRASLYDLPKRPLVTSFMAGLGGDVILLDDFYYMAKILQQMVKDRRTHQHVYWIGFE